MIEVNHSAWADLLVRVDANTRFEVTVSSADLTLMPLLFALGILVTPTRSWDQRVQLREQRPSAFAATGDDAGRCPRQQ